jgi:hypothetical protein
MMAAQRAQTGVCLAVLSGGWELEQSSHIWGESTCFVPLVFFILHDRYDRGRG